MSLKEVQQEIVSNMKSWQKAENATIALTGQIMEKTDNPIVRLVMEVIQRDITFRSGLPTAFKIKQCL